MSSDDTTRVPTTAKYLINRRADLAGACTGPDDAYSRRLSQYGENAVEPAMRMTWICASDV